MITPANKDQEILLRTARRNFEGAGFKGVDIRLQLEKILSEDKHLRECCANIGQLAQFLDSRFITAGVNLRMAGAPDEFLRDRLEEFVQLTYHQGRFKTIGLYHLFNFAAYESSLRVGDVRIERLDGPTVSRILGEPSIPSFLHPQGVGDYFVVADREGACDDFITWLVEFQQTAERFVEVLKYFKDGVVHIDYAVPHFSPEWVNQTRKWGVFFLGSPRRMPYQSGVKQYQISANDIQELDRWWAAYQLPAVTARLNDMTSSLRQADLRAAHYYESSHAEPNASDRLIDLTIALEALFSPTDQRELSYRICQYASQIVGNASPEREACFRDLKELYNRRSALMHGSYNVSQYIAGKFVTHDECDKWASIIRRCILRILTLYLRGTEDRSKFLSDLSRAALDPQLANKFREESDPQNYLNELIPQTQSTSKGSN